ncbi:MAG: class I SAM-dependent methyltransferase [Sulfitobacter sp.]
MIDTFYRDFELKFRQGPEVILQRLRVYEPFLKPLVTSSTPPMALDLGCGRGEWLGYLTDLGFQPRGVDLDEGMLGVARASGVDVENADALATLRAVPDGKLAVVSAFHLIEHLPFDMVREILNEARRALRPGGIVILETPNPENPLVGLVNFHLDPTHLKPVPAPLAGFAADHAGFARHTILRLNGSVPNTEAAVDLVNILSDISLDYAVIAQVDGPTCSTLDTAFEMRIGLNLHEGLSRYDNAQRDRLHQQKLKIMELREEKEAFQQQISALSSNVSFLQDIIERTWLECLLCRRTNGRPIRALRRILFHTNGKPRGITRNWIYKSDGTPRPTFKRWMASAEYLSLPWPSSTGIPYSSELTDSLLAFDPKRPRPKGLSEKIMTIEELVTKANRISGGGGQ